jgi:uncharacterized protein YukE
VSGDIDPAKLQGIDEDVPFAWTSSSDMDSGAWKTLAEAFDAMAEAVDDMTPWNNKAEIARQDWHGKANDVYEQRVQQGNDDAGQLATALRDAAEDVRALQRAAKAEQERRNTAREWKRAYDENEANESGLNQFGDAIFGEDFEAPPEPDYPEPEPNLESPPGQATDSRA